MSTINIKDKDKAAILAALYNASRPLGLGMLHYAPEQMSLDEARELLRGQSRFDYLKGRVMKIDLDEDELQTGLYDRENGSGAAETALRDAGLL